MTDLADLRRMLNDAVGAADTEQLADLVGMLEAVKVKALARLMRAQPQAAADTAQLVDAAEMARRLGTPENWVRDKARAGVLPFIRMGHYMRFEPPAVIEAARKLRLQSHNGAFCGIPKGKENRGGKRPRVHEVSKIEGMEPA